MVVASHSDSDREHDLSIEGAIRDADHGGARYEVRSQSQRT
jgi:hypothetical protein